MLWEHISQKKVGRFVTVDQTPRMKPRGLWLSEPGQWARFSRDESALWTCVVEISDGRVCQHPWHVAEGGGKDGDDEKGKEKERGKDNEKENRTRSIAHVDMSSVRQLTDFIARYRADGYRFEVDWAKVQGDFAGVYFSHVDKMPSWYFRAYNNSDGCWILSLDVDSVCIWDGAFIVSDVDVTWKEKEKLVA